MISLWMFSGVITWKNSWVAMLTRLRPKASDQAGGSAITYSELVLCSQAPAATSPKVHRKAYRWTGSPFRKRAADSSVLLMEPSTCAAVTWSPWA